MPHTFACSPCRFTLHGLLLKQDTVPYTALYPVARLWFPRPGEDGMNKDTKCFPVLSLFYRFLVARQKHLSDLKRAARLSLPRETLPGCGWKRLCEHSGGQKFTWEPLCASEEEILWFTKSVSPLQGLSDPDRDALLTGRQPWGCWANQGALQLIASDSDLEQRLPGKHRNWEKQTALLPSPQRCLKERSLSCLPPGHSACPPPSHQNSSWTDQ